MCPNIFRPARIAMAREFTKTVPAWCSVTVIGGMGHEPWNQIRLRTRPNRAAGHRDDDMIQALAAKDKAQEFVLQSLKARVDKYRPKEV